MYYIKINGFKQAAFRKFNSQNKFCLQNAILFHNHYISAFEELPNRGFKFNLSTYNLNKNVSKNMYAYFNKFNLYPLQSTMTSFCDIHFFRLFPDLELKNLFLKGLFPLQSVLLFYQNMKFFKFVTISVKTKGFGFSGVIKKYHFKRGPMSHGSRFHRKRGSVGSGSKMRRVLPLTKMASRFGFKTCTLTKIKLDTSNTLESLRLIFNQNLPGVRNARAEMKLCY